MVMGMPSLLVSTFDFFFFFFFSTFDRPSALRIPAAMALAITSLGVGRGPAGWGGEDACHTPFVWCSYLLLSQGWQDNVPVLGERKKAPVMLGLAAVVLLLVCTTATTRPG